MYNTPKHSSSNTNIKHQQKKPYYNQQSQKGNYRKENRYEEQDYDRQQYHKQKGSNQQNKGRKVGNQGPYQGNQYGGSGGKKLNVGKRYQSGGNEQETSYFLEYKGREVELGTKWKEAVYAVDKHFGRSDMVLNLAVKINIWDQLRDSSSFVVPREEIQDILQLYGKYRENLY